MSPVGEIPGIIWFRKLIVLLFILKAIKPRNTGFLGTLSLGDILKINKKHVSEDGNQSSF
jgi:hypothetical protein